MFSRFKNLLTGVVSNWLDPCPSLSDRIFEIAGKKIGCSVQGKSISVFSIGHGQKKVLFIAGIHGNEVGTVKLAHKLIQYLGQNQEKFKNLTCFVIPCLNPDGFELACNRPDYWHGGKIGRFNAHQVDLNRNFATPSFSTTSTWSFGKNYSRKTIVQCGAAGNSEPETRALTNFIQKEKIQFCYSFHNAGSDVVGGKDVLSQKLTAIFSDQSGFKFIHEDQWKVLGQTGTAKEWCENQGISFMEIEGSNRWNSDWGRQKGAILATLKAFDS